MSQPARTMLSPRSLTQAVWDVLETVEDPELPITITDLGLVHDVHVTDSRVAVRLVPTWIGCPALDVIRRRVGQALEAIPGVRDVTVEYTFEPPWTLDRMTPRGRARLQGHGLAVPRCRFSEPPACPYCGSRNVSLDSLFGPTMCRATYVCRDCRNPFERLKPPADPEDVSG